MGTLDLFCKTISGEKNLIKIDIWGWCEFFQNILVQLIICIKNNTVLYQKHLFKVFHKSQFWLIRLNSQETP